MSKQTKATWIWYPGDLEIWMHTKFSIRRTERGVVIPPFWRMDTFYGFVKFKKTISLEKPETVVVYSEGIHNVVLDDNMIYDIQQFVLPAGRHELIISVYGESCVPSIYVEGETIVSDKSWEVTCNNLKWVAADAWDFNEISQPPSKFKLEYEEIYPTNVNISKDFKIIDFGKEYFAKIKLNKIEGRGNIFLFYGESMEEALSQSQCETFDSINITSVKEESYITDVAKAFRYVNVVQDSSVNIRSISAISEYLPVIKRGRFQCSDDLLNRIWDTSEYTLHLNTREFYTDGIKRDRWVWCGDAYQSSLMNYYTYFDESVTKRTLIALRGKDPVETHINHIMDYSFYWFMSIYDYFMYTNDLKFVEQCYPKMLSLIEFCLARRNESDMMQGLPGDWVFVDWADMDKDGELSFQQLLLCRSLEITAWASEMFKDEATANKFNSIAAELKNKIFNIFWDSEKGALLHSRIGENLSSKITKYPNIFALLFKYLDEDKVDSIKKNVLLNENIQKITTPYMRFYEIAALCEVGEHNYVLDEILRYWGGMLDLGATSFWEEYDPKVKGSEHYAMYGRPFGKSLCHAWGASPLYLLGKYYLGIEPLTPGYETYRVEPHLGGLEWMEGTVPIPRGQIEIFMNNNTIKVKATCGTGYLKIKSRTQPLTSVGVVKTMNKDQYEIIMEPNNQYVISYT